MPTYDISYTCQIDDQPGKQEKASHTLAHIHSYLKDRCARNPRISFAISDIIDESFSATLSCQTYIAHLEGETGYTLQNQHGRDVRFRALSVIASHDICAHTSAVKTEKKLRYWFSILGGAAGILIGAFLFFSNRFLLRLTVRGIVCVIFLCIAAGSSFAGWLGSYYYARKMNRAEAHPKREEDMAFWEKTCDEIKEILENIRKYSPGKDSTETGTTDTPQTDTELEPRICDLQNSHIAEPKEQTLSDPQFLRIRAAIARIKSTGNIVIIGNQNKDTTVTCQNQKDKVVFRLPVHTFTENNREHCIALLNKIDESKDYEEMMRSCKDGREFYILINTSVNAVAALALLFQRYVYELSEDSVLPIQEYRY